PVPTAPPVPVEGRRGGAGWLWPALAGAALLLLYLAFRPGGFGFAPQATPTPRPPTSVSSGPAAGDTRVLEKAGITLVFVPAGSFEMGSNETEIDAALALCENYYCTFPRYWYETESPRHTVTLPEYWIGQTEVTNAQYRRFIDDGGYDKQSYWSAAGWSWKEERGISAPRFWTDSDWNGDSYPVVGVSWYEAEAYCRWAGARLPTEEEWEKASRGTDGRIFSWGSKWDGGRLNYCDSGCPYGWKDTAVNDGYFTTAPVGTYPRGASPYGALDMAGNVWEWVNAWYKGYPGTTYQNREFGEIYRVLRGGSWFHGPEQARCASRFRWLPDARGSWVGFRVVQ
ncbi:MAG TPA: formylglycine-generating enzyme family protein, partial [Anaerolineae bacterium]|nr:formylglycine-generating enzyme family protein [Anaerolineae bacterium]